MRTDHLSRRKKIELIQLLDERQRRKARGDLLEYTKRTFPGYRVGRHHREIADALMAVERGDIGRLMVIAPPRHGKSQLVSGRFPLWYLGRNPTREVIASSYGGDLAGDFGRQLRNLTYNPAHREVFPDLTLSADSKAADRWHTTQGGVYIAAGVGGAITGRGAHLLLIDDPVKSHEDAESETMREKTWNWYVSDAYSRLMKPNAVVVIQTRWHDDDLSGRLLEQMKDGGEQWTILHYPAIDEDGNALWPEMYPVSWLDNIRKTVGARIWQGLYQGDPTPDEGIYFESDWFNEFEAQPKHLQIYGASDFAVTHEGGDYTVHIVVGIDPQDRIYVLDVWRKQARSDVWIESLLDMVDRWKPLRWALESGQIEKSVGPFLGKRIKERRSYCHFLQYTSAADKPTRARAFQARMSQGDMVHFPAGAGWYPEMRSEMLKFPLGKHDDQVDTLSLIGRMLDQLAPGREPDKPQPARTAGVMLPGQPHPAEHPMTYDDLMREVAHMEAR